MAFQIYALIILAAFYGCYFAKMLLQRREGIETDQIGKGKKGFVLFIEISMKIFTILAPIAEIVSIVLNTSHFPTPVRLVGALLALIGLTAFILAVINMKDSWRAGVSATDKTELVTDGIYRISRNPAFLGFGLVYAGMLLMFFNLYLFAVSVLASLFLHLQIVNVEEDHLITAFGDEYLSYKKQVNRYFGRRNNNA